MSKATRGSVGAERARASGGPADPSATSRGRFSVKKKAEAVLRVMRGESLDSVSRDLGVTAAKLCAAVRVARSVPLWRPGRTTLSSERRA